jgi:formylglycine-generating enzyme required for sulfatase activity
MHDSGSAPLAQMHLEDAARSVFPKFDGQMDAAREFLEYQAGHGALLVKRSSDISFSHFSFQEYLAAAAIAGLTDADQRAVLFERPERLYDAAWLDTIRFLAGILSDHADVRLVQAVSTVLAHPGIREPVEAVSCAALLAAMEEELITEIPIAPPETLASLAELVKTALVEQPFDSWPEPVRLRSGAFAGRHARPRPPCWRQVKGGWFLMGGQSASKDGRGYDPEARPVESPPHRVSVESFEMLALPVTVEMWGEFIRQGGYRDEKWWTAGGFGRWTAPLGWPKQTHHPTLPVTGVSWFEAMACCQWLRGRLPTEAEWEFAAAGRKHRRFPWGDEPPEPSRARFGHRTGGIAPVGLYPNGLTPEEGIFDMAGNAWEWVFDRFGPYSGDESRDPAGPDEGDERVLRGGSWINPATFLPSSTRIHCRPEMRYCTFGPIGFRCVRQ